MILDRTHEPNQPTELFVSTLPPTGGLIIWVEQHAGDVVVHLEGDLDLAGGDDLAATMAALTGDALHRVTVDATVVRFIDLSGYRALVRSVAPSAASVAPTLLVGAAVDRLRMLSSVAGCTLEP